MAEPTIHSLLGLKGKYKERSHKTFHNVHVPEIRGILASAQATNKSTTSTKAPTPPTNLPPEVILIGDSMLERFRTTGRSAHAQISSRPHTFNAGVGGDKIENVLYRLDQGLLQRLQPLAPRLWVVHIGTNNLHDKASLQPSALDNYALLLRALLSGSPSDAQVLAVAIFPRKDIDDAIVRTSNLGIQEAVKAVNIELGNERIWFVEQPEELTKARLQDHVHLDRDGYRLWDRVLAAKIDSIIDGKQSAGS